MPMISLGLQRNHLSRLVRAFSKYFINAHLSGLA
jgi:hypothetical protein